MFVKLFARAGAKLPVAETFCGIQALLIYNAQAFLSDNPSDRVLGELHLTTIAKVRRLVSIPRDMLLRYSPSLSAGEKEWCLRTRCRMDETWGNSIGGSRVRLAAMGSIGRLSKVTKVPNTF
jgi:hypothetical protein